MSDGDSCLLIFQVPARSVSRRELSGFANELQRHVTNGRSFCALITDDSELRRLNREFRGKDYATDVLSFPAEREEGGLGDLAISWDRAKAQAAEHGHSVADELRILILHGVLHLTGQDHETDTGQMARAEMRWRRRFKLPIGLIERVGA